MLSDPLQDLNAMHEAEKHRSLRAQGLFVYVANLVRVLKRNNATINTDSLDRADWVQCCIFATALERAEALLNTVAGSSVGALNVAGVDQVIEIDEYGKVHYPTGVPQPRIHNMKMLRAIQAAVLEHSGNEQLAEHVTQWLSASSPPDTVLPSPKRETAQQFITRLKDALIWCSGSQDFSDGGQAREGWLRVCAPLIDGAETTWKQPVLPEKEEEICQRCPEYTYDCHCSLELPEAPEDNVSAVSQYGLLPCPFCKEPGFDLPGLAWHIQNYCNDYTVAVLNKFREGNSPATTVPASPEVPASETGYSVHQVPCPYEHGGFCTCDWARKNKL
jgi:hypothetical protein